ncbi:MAG: glycosyltransferase family 39 protein [Patescibacteria group bacterium]|nr:glycosyltransferase family 39 protein [Patescibacteria group bacterium]
MINWLFTKTPLFFLVQSFWRDEAFSYLLAKKNLGEIISLTAADFNPPLYYFFLHFWIKIFGPSEIALRTLSLIFYWATIYLIFLFLTKVFKIKSSWQIICYLLLIAINPAFVYYAFEARMYTMLAFFATLSFYSFFFHHKKLYLFSLIAGLYTHYFMILVFFNQLIISFLSKKKHRFLTFKTIFLSFLLFLPWLIFFVFKNKFSVSFWIKKPTMVELKNFLGIIFTGNDMSFYPSTIIKEFKKSLLIISLFTTMILIKGIFIYYKKLSQEKKYLFQMLFLWATIIPLFVLLISFIKPIFLPRYLIFSTIGLLLFLIFIIENLNLKSKIVLISLLFFLSFSYQKLQLKYQKKTDFKKIVREIKILAKKDDLLYVTNELDFHTAQYYFDENRVFIYNKSYQEIPSYVGKILIPAEKIVNYLPIYPKKAFVLKDNGSFDIQSVY